MSQRTVRYIAGAGISMVRYYWSRGTIQSISCALSATLQTFFFAFLITAARLGRRHRQEFPLWGSHRRFPATKVSLRLVAHAITSQSFELRGSSRLWKETILLGQYVHRWTVKITSAFCSPLRVFLLPSWGKQKYRSFALFSIAFPRLTEIFLKIVMLKIEAPLNCICILPFSSFGTKVTILIYLFKFFFCVEIDTDNNKNKHINKAREERSSLEPAVFGLHFISTP